MIHFIQSVTVNFPIFSNYHFSHAKLSFMSSSWISVVKKLLKSHNFKTPPLSTNYVNEPMVKSYFQKQR